MKRQARRVVCGAAFFCCSMTVFAAVPYSARDVALLYVRIEQAVNDFSATHHAFPESIVILQDAGFLQNSTVLNDLLHGGFLTVYNRRAVFYTNIAVSAVEGDLTTLLPDADKQGEWYRLMIVGTHIQATETAGTARTGQSRTKQSVLPHPDQSTDYTNVPKLFPPGTVFLRRYEADVVYHDDISDLLNTNLLNERRSNLNGSRR